MLSSVPIIESAAKAAAFTGVLFEAQDQIPCQDPQQLPASCTCCSFRVLPPGDFPCFLHVLSCTPLSPGMQLTASLCAATLLPMRHCCTMSQKACTSFWELLPFGMLDLLGSHGPMSPLLHGIACEPPRDAIVAQSHLFPLLQFKNKSLLYYNCYYFSKIKSKCSLFKIWEVCKNVEKEVRGTGSVTACHIPLTVHTMAHVLLRPSPSLL